MEQTPPFLKSNTHHVHVLVSRVIPIFLSCNAIPGVQLAAVPISSALHSSRRCGSRSPIGSPFGDTVYEWWAIVTPQLRKCTPLKKVSLLWHKEIGTQQLWSLPSRASFFFYLPSASSLVVTLLAMDHGEFIIALQNSTQHSINTAEENVFETP